VGAARQARRGGRGVAGVARRAWRKDASLKLQVEERVLMCFCVYTKMKLRGGEKLRKWGSAGDATPPPKQAI